MGTIRPCLDGATNETVSSHFAPALEIGSERTLICAEMIEQKPVMTRQLKSWLFGSRVIHKMLRLLRGTKMNRKVVTIACFVASSLFLYLTLLTADFESTCISGKHFVYVLSKNNKHENSNSTIYTNITSFTGSQKKQDGDPLQTINVYYIWCKRQQFEFRHYLSVKSAIDSVKADNIIFYYRYYPLIDNSLYNVWIQELQDEFPFFQTVQAPSKACNQYERPSIPFIYDLINERKGIYLGENTIIVRQLPNHDRDALAAVRVHPEQIDLFTVKKKLSCSPEFLVGNVSVVDCPLVSRMDKALELPFCVVLDKMIFPKHIWNLESAFGRLARTLFYGTSSIPRPKQSYKELAPNIGHVTWFGGGRMDFLFFLNVLSLLYVAGVDTVYIHGDLPPSGYYWELLQNNSRIKHVFHDKLHMVYGQSVESFNHKSDVLRGEILYQYGGVYIDTDAVFVRPLDREIRSYDAVASYDWIDWDHPFPEIVNLGVAIGKKKAEYFRLFRESLKWFRDDDFSWNGLRRPYQILERHPDLLNIDPHLQVICYLSKCHATWWNDFHDSSVNHLNRNIDWKKDAYVFHWTHPTPNELGSYESLLKSSGMFSDIGKYILNRSGLVDFFEKKVPMR